MLKWIAASEGDPGSCSERVRSIDVHVCMKRVMDVVEAKMIKRKDTGAVLDDNITLVSLTHL